MGRWNITHDEHLLISEVVEFLECTQKSKENLKKQEVQLNSLILRYLPRNVKSALVDNELVEDEITLLETFECIRNLDEIHQKLLNLAMQEPVYSDSIKTYNLTLETALNDGIITSHEEAMLATLEIIRYF